MHKVKNVCVVKSNLLGLRLVEFLKKNVVSSLADRNRLSELMTSPYGTGVCLAVVMCFDLITAHIAKYSSVQSHIHAGN